MKRVRQGKESFWERRDEGVGPLALLIILGIVIAGGYFTTQAIMQWNKPAVEAVQSTSPLNEGLGVLLADIGAHWLETIVLIMGGVVLLAYIKKKRGK